jgi:hypothetical protein
LLTLLNRNTRLALLVALLIFTAALRIQHLVDFVEWPDELWSVWVGQLNLRDGLIHSDPFWPPLFDILVWVWMHIVGQTLEAQRFVQVLFALLAVTFVYRAALKLHLMTSKAGDYDAGQRAALLSGLVFATMAYSIFVGVDVRGYGLLLTLLPFTFWMTLRWLHKPARRNAILAVIVLALLLHTSYSSLAFIPLLTLFVLVMRPRLFRHWFVMGIGVLILVLPIVPRFLENQILGRFAVFPAPLPPFGEAMLGIYRDFGGSIWFLALLLIAVGLLAIRAINVPSERRVIVFLAIWVLFPALTYFTIHNNDFWKARYLWWVASGLALLIGYAFAHLPRAAIILVTASFLILPALPTNFFAYRLAETTSPPFRMVLTWFAQHVRPGDVLVIDPKCTCGKPTGWDYFVPQFFPTGILPTVERPGSASRVWYLSNDGWGRDDALYAEVQKGRKPSIFVGPWYFLLRLYEGPPSWEGVSFGGKIRFHGMEILNTGDVLSDNEQVHVKLWWSAQEPLPEDYSISLAVLDSNGKLITQKDGVPLAPDTPGQLSAWKKGTYYEDFRELLIPPGLAGGTYSLVITVYQYRDGVRLKPDQNANWPRTDADYLLVKTVQVGSPW